MSATPASHLPPQSRLEIRAMMLGVVTSTILAAAIVIAGLKAGITPGVSPLVVLLAWAVFARSLPTSGAHLVLNQAQVTGSAGVAVTAGIIFTAPLLPILSRAQGLPYDGLPLFKLMGASLAGALIGFGYVGLNARRMLSDSSLPAPEARACEAMIRVATHQYNGPNETSSAATVALDGRLLDSRKPRLMRSLIPGVLHGFAAPLLATIGLAASKITVLSLSFAQSARSVEFKLPYMPIYFGIGGLLSLGTAIAAFLGTLIRLSADAGLASVSTSSAHWPDTSLRWIGGGAMTVAVLWSMVRLGVGQRFPHDDHGPPIHPHTLDFSARTRKRLILAIATGSVLLLVGIVALSGLSVFSISLAVSVTVLAAFLVALGAFLSLQIGSSASPVSGAIFLMTLALCALALAAGRGQSAADLELMTLVLVAACVAVATSNDTSQDYRTLQLSNVPIARGFVGQLLGLLAAVVIVPLTIVLAERAFGLGGDALPAPQGQLFATVVEGMLFERQLPWRPILVGALIGAAAVGLEIAGKKRHATIPAMALAVGLYLPPELGVGLLLGALARYAGDRAKIERSESILTAGGLITGAALFDLLIGVAMLGGVSLTSLKVFSLPPTVLNVVACGGIAWVMWLLYRSAHGRRTHASSDVSS